MNALPAEFVQGSIGRVPTPMSTPTSQVSTPPSGRSRPSLEWTTSQLGDEPEVRDPENLEVRLMNELVLGRRIESNTLPFLVHDFASWSAQFIFENTQIIPVVADHIRHSRSFDPQTRQTMLLIFNTSLAISRTTDYNLPQFTTLQRQLIGRVREARAPDDTELTRELALATMEHSYQIIYLAVVTN
ncbi:unnamed protein product [Rhizoctonia solani]|uniref:Uncharacterized protein n=1 Tax=Rhizoctonia solani TaxID=456999 RepID=A0A8H3DBN3_9AGAM|nr:unnamed protein product [Rhizoctonia solani]